MASQKKLRKIAKKLHWGRGKWWFKSKGKGVKGVSFYTPSDRQESKKVDVD